MSVIKIESIENIEENIINEDKISPKPRLFSVIIKGFERKIEKQNHLSLDENQIKQYQDYYINNNYKEFNSFNKIEECKNLLLKYSNVKPKADYIINTGHITVTGDQGAVTPRQFAKILFDNISIPLDQISTILCRNDAYHHEACKEYMNLFELKDIELIDALRLLMKKIPLIGETHAIERMLRSFSHRYFIINNKSKNGLSENTYHLLICSMILLNSDFYATKKCKKMSKKNYIQNIKNAINPGHTIPSDELLSKIYESIRKEQLPTHVFESNNTSIENNINDNNKSEDLTTFPILKTSAIKFSVKSKSFNMSKMFGNKWNIGYATLNGLNLILHKNKDNIDNYLCILNISHGFAEPIYKKSTKIKHRFLLHLQNGITYKLWESTHDRCTEWIMYINASAALLSTPQLPYTVGNPPIFKKRGLYPETAYSGSIDKLIELWLKRFKEISDILEKNLTYKSKPNQKQLIRISIKSITQERTRLLKYINLIKGFDRSFLIKFLHPSNKLTVDELEKCITNAFKPLSN